MDDSDWLYLMSVGDPVSVIMMQTCSPKAPVVVKDDQKKLYINTAHWPVQSISQLNIGKSRVEKLIRNNSDRLTVS